MRISAVSLSVVLLVAPFCTGGEKLVDKIPGAKPVDPGQLDGKRLRLKLTKATIEAPGQDWEWFASPKVPEQNETYFCINEQQKKLFSLAITRGGNLTEKKMPEFVRGMKEGVEKTNVKITEPVYAPSDVPKPGPSFRLSTVISHPNGMEIPMLVYVTSDRRYIYSTTLYEWEKDEPAEFRQFAASLEIPKVQAPYENLLYFGIGLIGWLLGLAAQALYPKRAQLPYEVALCAVIGALLVQIYLLLMSSIPEIQMSQRLGEEVGRALLPLGGLLWLAYRARPKAQKAQSVPPQQPPSSEPVSGPPPAQS